MTSSGNSEISVDLAADAGVVNVDTIAGDDIINASESGAATIAVSGTASGGDIAEGDSVTVTVNGTETSDFTYSGAGNTVTINSPPIGEGDVVEIDEQHPGSVARRTTAQPRPIEARTPRFSRAHASRKKRFSTDSSVPATMAR